MALVLPISKVIAKNYWPRVLSIAISPNWTNDGTVFINTLNIYKSTDKGENWDVFNKGSAFTRLGVIFSPSYTSDNTLFAIGVGGIYKSTNGGNTWSLKNSGIIKHDGRPIQIRAISISPNYSSDQTLFIGETSKKSIYKHIYRSTDGGNNWNLVNNTMNWELSSIVISTTYATDNTVFAGADYLYKSSDGGSNWTKDTSIDEAISSIAIAPNFLTTQTIFVSNYKGIYKSIDGGSSWKNVHSLNATSLMISPNYSLDNTIFAASPYYGSSKNALVHKSTDGGATWKKVINGITNRDVMSLAISPNFANDRTIFAGTWDGLFMSTNGGASWREKKVDKTRPKTYARKRFIAKRVSKKKAPRYLKLYRANRGRYKIYKNKYRKTRNRTLRRRYQKAATRYKKLTRKYRDFYSLAKKGLARAKVYWKVIDHHPKGARSYPNTDVAIKIQKKIKSRSGIKRKARYLKLYRMYRAKHLKTRNRTLRKRYKKKVNKYLRAYKKQKRYKYITVKTAKYMWPKINVWRYYYYKTKNPGAYRYLVFATDIAENKQRNVARGYFRIK